jgi:hypothetical protein
MGHTFPEIYIQRGDTSSGNFATRVNGASSKIATGVDGNLVNKDNHYHSTCTLN